MTGALVEVLLLSAAQNQLYFRTRTAELGHRTPDVLARRLVGGGVGVLHSTSWRFDGSRVVLTYIALPDPAGHAGARPLVARDLARGAHPTAPSPIRLSIDEVAVHACRHLSFLRCTDPHVTEVARDGMPIWDLIEATFAPALAGALPSPAS
jgi:hypothetical protein